MKEVEETTTEKTLQIKCTFCKKEIPCPKKMLKAEYHACFSCFEEREEEMEKLNAEGKLHVAIPKEEAIVGHILGILEEGGFPEVWKGAKEDMRELSKKELAEEMFFAGAHAALRLMVELGDQEEWIQDEEEVQEKERTDEKELGKELKRAG